MRLTHTERTAQFSLQMVAGPIKAADLGNVLIGELATLAPLGIHQRGHWFEVAWIDTQRVLTEMIQLQPGRDRAYQAFVIDLVSDTDNPASILRTDADLSVAPLFCRSSPEPTSSPTINPIAN